MYTDHVDTPPSRFSGAPNQRPSFHPPNQRPSFHPPSASYHPPLPLALHQHHPRCFSPMGRIVRHPGPPAATTGSCYPAPSPAAATYLPSVPSSHHPIPSAPSPGAHHPVPSAPSPHHPVPSAPRSGVPQYVITFPPPTAPTYHQPLLPSPPSSPESVTILAPPYDHLLDSPRSDDWLGPDVAEQLAADTAEAVKELQAAFQSDTFSPPSHHQLQVPPSPSSQSPPATPEKEFSFAPIDSLFPIPEHIDRALYPHHGQDQGPYQVQAPSPSFSTNPGDQGARTRGDLHSSYIPDPDSYRLLPQLPKLD